MPKRSKLSEPTNVPNPFARKALKVTVDEDVKRKGKRAKEVVTETPDEDINADLLPVKSEVKEEPNFNLYVGTELGIVKGVAIGGELPISKSFLSTQDLKTRPPAVVSLAWADDAEKELLVCLSNLVVKSYNTKLRCFTRQILLDGDKPEVKTQKVVDICPQESGYVYGLENGIVALWSCRDAEVALTVKTIKDGGDPKCDLRRIRQCPEDKNFYATGGNENDLKIWNFGSETPEVPVFKARNVPHDFLDLRVPVWIQDLTFMPRTTEVVAVGTRYGQVRLYDVRASPRPVSNVQFADHPVMSITSTMDDRKVIVGTAKGEAGMYDLRNPGKEKLCLKYGGFSGSIRTIQACNDLPYFVSAGLDRHLYIHKFTERAPIKKLYLKQQVNCITLSKTFMKDSTKGKPGNEVAIDDWANIPPEILDVSLPSLLPVDSPSPVKKLRKAIRS